MPGTVLEGEKEDAETNPEAGSKTSQKHITANWIIMPYMQLYSQPAAQLYF